MSEYYCSTANGTEGPFSKSDLAFLVDRGEIPTNSLVRQGQQGDWLPIGTVVPRVRTRASRTSTPTTPTRLQRRRLPRRSEPVSHEPPTAVVEPVTASPPPPVPAGGATGVRQRSQRTAVVSIVVAAVLLLLLLLALLLLVSNGFGTGGGSGSSAGSGSGSGGATGSGAAEQGEDDSDQSSESGSDGSSTPPSSGSDPSPPPKPPADVPADGFPSVQGPSSDDSDRFSVGGGEFFGLAAEGDRYVYVVDCSGSMSGERFEAATREIVRSTRELLPEQEFYVIFFSDEAYPMFSPASAESGMLKAVPGNLNKLAEWVDDFSVKGGTDPSDAMDLALRLKPDVVFMLTDGGFSSAVATEVEQKNTSGAAIFTVAFKSRSGETLLHRIANENSGKYHFVP